MSIQVHVSTCVSALIRGLYIKCSLSTFLVGEYKVFCNWKVLSALSISVYPPLPLHVYLTVLLPNNRLCTLWLLHRLSHTYSFTWYQSERVRRILSCRQSKQDRGKLSIFSFGKEKTGTWTEVWEAHFRQKSSTGATMHCWPVREGKWESKDWSRSG